MATPQPQSGAQPKIVQTLLKRTLAVLLAFAAIFGGLRWMQSRNGDYDNGGDSAGLMAAIRLEANGQQAVLIKPDGSVVGTSSWKDGVTDREPAWAPSGKFLFFCSDRKDRTFNVFRWNPQADDAQVRTEKGGRDRSNPTFAPGQGDDNPLIVVGGFVRELDPTTGKSLQILPPVNAEIAHSGAGSEEGEGTEGALSAVYGGLGKSFRIARYLPGKQSIVAVLRRDEGESLIVQELTLGENGKLSRPSPIVTGDRIDFDIDPTTGAVIYTVQGFRWPDNDNVPPQFRKGNKILTPFRNGIGIVDPAKRSNVSVAQIPTNAPAFGAPHVSPDGSRILLVGGAVEEGSLRPDTLFVMPLRERGYDARSILTKGDIYEPAWSPDSKRIAYAKRIGGKRDLFSMNSDGSDERNLTNGKADFMSPLFSPMVGK